MSDSSISINKSKYAIDKLRFIYISTRAYNGTTVHTVGLEFDNDGFPSIKKKALASLLPEYDAYEMAEELKRFLNVEIIDYRELFRKL